MTLFSKKDSDGCRFPNTYAPKIPLPTIALACAAVSTSQHAVSIDTHFFCQLRCCFDDWNADGTPAKMTEFRAGTYAPYYANYLGWLEELQGDTPVDGEGWGPILASLQKRISSNCQSVISLLCVATGTQNHQTSGLKSSWGLPV